jgi:hypothetical protein
MIDPDAYLNKIYQLPGQIRSGKYNQQSISNLQTYLIKLGRLEFTSTSSSLVYDYLTIA